MDVRGVRGGGAQLTGDGRHGVGSEVNTIRTAPWIWADGGRLADDEDRPTRFELDTPEGRRGLDHLLALRRNGVAPFPKSVEEASLLHSDGFCIAKGADADAA